MKFFYSIVLTCLAQCSFAEKLEVLSNVDMFDVGLALINDDDLYDIYTINHNFAESYLLNEDQTFKLYKNLGLSQTTELPLYEPVGKSPEIKTGLNIFSPNRKSMILHCNGCSKQADGHILIPTPLKETDSVVIKYQQNGTATSALVTEGGEHFIKIKFTLNPMGIVVLEPTFPDLLFRFNVNLPADEIFVGHASSKPKKSAFIYNTQDNHSSAWAMLDDNSSTDVFMSTGGLRARIKHFSPKQVIPEQIYSFNAQKKAFEDATAQFKFTHTKCRTYKSMWIDFDNDSDLDLYQGCLNGKNKLHIQNGVGTGVFKETAAKYKTNLRQADEFKWFDYNNDGWLDLIAVDKNRLKVLSHKRTNQVSSFKTQFVSQIMGKQLNSVTTSIKVADYNNNGRPTFFVTTSKQLYIFDVDSHGKIQALSLNQLNLPEVLSGHITFADVNFDGALDLISFSKGVYLNKNNKFEPSNMLPDLFVDKKHHFKNLIWFDAENNGQWDIINAESFPVRAKTNRTILDYHYRDMKVWDNLEVIRNLPNTNHWIHVDLIGNKYNKSAIGAKIKIKSPNQIQYRQVMGTEDSYHSQGHYRQYFGIGTSDFVDIEVTWPNGKTQKLNKVAANQLIKINHKNNDSRSKHQENN